MNGKCQLNRMKILTLKTWRHLVKQTLILLSLLFVLAFACNRNQEVPGNRGEGAGMQKEESLPSKRSSDLEREEQNQMGSGINTEE